MSDPNAEDTARIVAGLHDVAAGRTRSLTDIRTAAAITRLREAWAHTPEGNRELARQNASGKARSWSPQFRAFLAAAIALAEETP